MVADSEAYERLETPFVPNLSRPRSPPDRPPAKGNVLTKIGMLSTAEDPAHGNCSPCSSPAVDPPLRRPPAFAGGALQSEGTRLCDHSAV
jgi:hypothetical protein